MKDPRRRILEAVALYLRGYGSAVKYYLDSPFSSYDMQINYLTAYLRKKNELNADVSLILM